MKKVSITNIVLLFAMIVLSVWGLALFVNPDFKYQTQRNQLSGTFRIMNGLSRILDSFPQDALPSALAKAEAIYGVEQYQEYDYIAIDLITKKEFIYKKYSVGNTEKWYLVSPGFDLTLDSSFPPESAELIVQYDPTNGLTSSGDIVFSSNLSPRDYLTSDAHPRRKGVWEPSSDGYRKKPTTPVDEEN